MFDTQKYWPLKCVLDAQKPLLKMWLRNSKYMKCVRQPPLHPYQWPYDTGNFG